ncbi:YbdD/YjiX family protein [Mycobacterium sp. IS-3022]|uniref:YbdD/YjiX family protein n=1 Tax=Mycobacterium sp. IS-3022 TaxID=1772277 RepID=UPI0009E820AC|nr:YbdD/YjiX family protein [Mycobacterium sp. IS-3022]
MGRVVEVARKFGWHWGTLIGDLMGDTHYRRYVEHRMRIHPGEPVLSERDYWRMRHAAADANPIARCC